MAVFTYLNKESFPELAPDLFRLMMDNMDAIAPSGKAREEEFQWWFREVGAGLRAPARKILLIWQSGTERLIGFLQYYTNQTTFMIEELQFLAQWQGTAGVLKSLFGFVLANLPPDLRYVEAFVHKGNTRSLALQNKLGMRIVGTAQEDTMYHLRGDYLEFANWYYSRRER